MAKERRINEKWLDIKKLSRSQLNIFFYIKDMGIVKMTTISYALDIDLSYCCRIVNSLESLGYIRKIYIKKQNHYTVNEEFE